MITQEAVLKALSHVDDPDLKKDLVTLGMIEDLEIGQNISFTLEQGPEVVAPTPTPKPTKPPVVVDTCKGQIKN